MDFILLASIYGAMAIMGGALWYLFKNTVLDSEKTLYIKIANEFSNIPKGRETSENSPDSGERFRKEFLEPNFEKYDKIIIDFDDLCGCPSSFRDGSFGQLARTYGKSTVMSKLEFICNDQPYLQAQLISSMSQRDMTKGGLQEK